ncbi:MAG TPA: AMP-binding protein, partial [Polyangia bacterium]
METAMAATAKVSAPKAAERPLSVQNAVVMFNDRVKASASQSCLRWKEGGTWRTATWSDWDKASREIAGGLIALGVGKGERSCILATTRPEWLYCDIGILMAGGVTVPIYQSNLPHECEYIINDSGAKIVFVENPQQLAKVMAERDKMSGVVKVVYFDASCKLEKPDAQGRTELKLEDVTQPGDKAWLMSLGELRVEGDKWLGAHAGELEKRWAEIKADDSFTFVYTSGTTGPP